MLIVDDDVGVAYGFARALREYDVTVVTDARAALALVTAGERYDIIISDLVMPEMTGMDLHCELHHVAPDQAAAMVFASGSLDAPAAREFIASIPNVSLEKPIPAGALRAIVERWLRRM